MLNKTGLNSQDNWEGLSHVPESLVLVTAVDSSLAWSVFFLGNNHGRGLSWGSFIQGLLTRPHSSVQHQQTPEPTGHIVETWLHLPATRDWESSDQIFFFNSSVVALQCCVISCQTTVWISYKYTYILSSWASLPSHPSRLAPCTVRQLLTSCLNHNSKTHMNTMCTAALLTIAKTWKLPRCP